VASFDRARRRAVLADLLRPLLGRPLDLLPFEEVRERLHLRHLVDRGVGEVPLERIVGSLGREREFTRAFLPRHEALRERWQEVLDLAEGPRGYPPVELYQVGEAYFVVDGHHRVSVARAHGAPAIEARVQEYSSPLPLDADTSLEELVLEGARADFLEATGLQLETENEFRASELNAYERLAEHVAVHRYFLGLDLGREVAWSEAVRSWRQTLYRPMIEAIRDCGVLSEFPGRTETDLYLFLMDHLHYLRSRRPRAKIAPTDAVRDVASAKSAALGGHLGQRVRAWVRGLG
jgi:hypothetical protein